MSNKEDEIKINSMPEDEQDEMYEFDPCSFCPMVRNCPMAYQFGEEDSDMPRVKPKYYPGKYPHYSKKKHYHKKKYPYPFYYPYMFPFFDYYYNHDDDDESWDDWD